MNYFFVVLFKFIIMKLLKFSSLAILLCGFSYNLEAQIYAKNAYMYVADNFLFAKGNVNLDTGGNIFLRNESQLLQGSTSTSTNTGTGKLSVFQEGTTNAWSFNYWCSPVGNATATVGNDNFGITMINRPTDATNSVPAVTTGQSGYNGSASPLGIEPWFVWKYQTSDTYDPNATGWIQVRANPLLAAGQGFTMKGTNGSDNTVAVATEDGDVFTAGVQAFKNREDIDPDGSGPITTLVPRQRYDFRGKPNDGNIDINIATGKYTLTGNPYPSAINLSSFLTSATTTTGIAYFWEDDKSLSTHQMVDSRGGYGTYSPVGGAGLGIYTPAKFYAYDLSGTQIGPQTGTGGTYERFFSPIGQGFMLLGASNGVAQMNNSFRVYTKESAANRSQFERNAYSSADFLPQIPSVSGFDYTTVSTLPTPQIRFKTVTNQLGVGQMVLGFTPNATDGKDFAMDAVSAEEGKEEVAFLIEESPYVIDIVNFDIDKKIPLGFKNETEANFKISVHEILNFYDAEHVFIHDKDNDVYTEITNDVYEVTLPAGNNKTRFEITFKSTTALATDMISLVDFDVYQNNVSSLLTILNPKSVDLREISLFDISGKLIFSKDKLGNDKNYQFSTAAFSEAIYLVKIITADGKIQGKKVAIFKTK